MNRHKAARMLNNVLLLKLLVIPIIILIKPEVIILYPATLICDILITAYLSLYTNGYIKRWDDWWKEGIRRAKIRKREREEWLIHLRRSRGYNL